MKVYGKKNEQRCMKVGEMSYNEFKKDNSAIRFVKEHNLLGEFIANMEAENEEEYDVFVDTENSNMESIEYNGERYWYGRNPLDTELHYSTRKMVGFYKELPNVYDDARFHWKRNKKYDSMECTIESGIFSYHCIYKSDGNAIVDVKYNACDNKHRNRVTIATIEIEYATNVIINRAIIQWKQEFKEMISCA